MINNSIRLHALKALTSLSKFLGIYEDFRRLVKNYGLKCSDKNTDDLIIGRLTKTVNPDEIFQWIRSVKEHIPEISDLMDLMAVTGLRLVEAIEAYNLIIRLAGQRKLGEYFNAERQVLEHFRFKEIFIRNSKKVFISFVPKELVDRISRSEPLTYDRVRKRVERRIVKSRFGDIRELHGTLATEYLKESEIDFLHGRISSSVFMKNYFNPMWIKDLEERAFKVIEQIQNNTCTS